MTHVVIIYNISFVLGMVLLCESMSSRNLSSCFFGFCSHRVTAISHMNHIYGLNFRLQTFLNLFLWICRLSILRSFFLFHFQLFRKLWFWYEYSFLLFLVLKKQRQDLVFKVLRIHICHHTKLVNLLLNLKHPCVVSIIL